MGRIRSWKRYGSKVPRLLTGRLTTSKRSAGYVSVKLRTEAGHKKSFLVHRLVLLTFCGKPATGQECDHINYDRSDNRLSNLRWLSTIENNRHSAQHRSWRPSVNPRGNIKLTVDIVKDIRSRRANGETLTFLAKKHGISLSSASRVANHLSWKEVA